MHLTLYIQPCHFISTIMKIDKRELSYHNPTYITAGNCYFRRLQVKEMSGTEQAGRKSCLPVADQMLSGRIDGGAHGDASRGSLS